MAYTDWRITVFATRGGLYWQVTEVAFLDAQGVDVSAGGVASAGSVYSASYDAAKAFDKNLGTDYCNEARVFPAWLQYQLPTPADIKGMRIRWASSDDWLPVFTESMEVTALQGNGVAQRFVLKLDSGGIISSTEAVFSLTPWVPPLANIFGELLTVAQSPVPDRVLQLGTDLLNVRDMEFGGPGVIYGTVSDDRTKKPVQCRVRLRRSRDGLLAREVWSKADGSYRFDGLTARYEYDIEAWDHEKNYFSVVANNQIPEVAA